jgi:hypothetical protein
MNYGFRKFLVSLTFITVFSPVAPAFAKNSGDDPAAPDIQCEAGEVMICADDGTLACYPDARASQCKNGRVFFVPVGMCQDQDPDGVNDAKVMCKMKPPVSSLGRANTSPKNSAKGAVNRGAKKTGSEAGSSTRALPASTSGSGDP